MFYDVFCNVHTIYMWSSIYFCDVHVLYMWCSTYFRMFIYYKCMFHDFFKFPWDILCYILDCLSNIHVMIFFNLPLLRGFFFSLVICSMLFVIFQCMLCYLFIYLFSIYFIGFILIFMKVIIPIALTYNLFSRSRILFL